MLRGHAPEERKKFTVVPGEKQSSVPLTVTLEVPCVIVDGESDPLKVHASTGCVVVCIAGPTVNVVLITLLLGFGSLSVEIDQVRV